MKFENVKSFRLLSSVKEGNLIRSSAWKPEKPQHSERGVPPTYEAISNQSENCHVHDQPGRSRVVDLRQLISFTFSVQTGQLASLVIMTILTLVGYCLVSVACSVLHLKIPDVFGCEGLTLGPPKTLGSKSEINNPGCCS